MPRLIRKPKRVTQKASDLYTFKIHNIVIVGSKDIRRRLAIMESSFNIELRFCDLNMLQTNINSKTIAILVCEDKIASSVKVCLSKLLSTYSDKPIYYLATSIEKPNFYHNLYARGLKGVISWPIEGKILHELLIETMRPQSNVLGKTKADKKLAVMAKSHLMLEGNYKNIKIKSIDGFLFVEGKVKTLLEKEIIKRELANILGVKKVVLKNLKIRSNNSLSDRDLERKIKMYLANIFGTEKRSLAVKVKDKIVHLFGASKNLQDVLTVESFIKKQKGVQKIIRKIKYSPSLVTKRVKKTKELEMKIKDLFEGVKFISISIYGESAEISGTVKLSRTKNLIEDYLLQELPITKVINKLFVSQNK